MAATLNAARGRYLVELAGPPQATDSGLVATVSLARADGIERFGLCCRIAGIAVIDEAILSRIADVIAREFEQVREAALKSIRTERKLFEIAIELVPA